MPRIKMPSKREKLLKRKFPKAFREDSIMSNASISYEEQKKIDDEASVYWGELQEKSDEEIDAIFEEYEKRSLAEFEENNPIPSREDVYIKFKSSGVTCPEGVTSLAAMMLFGYKKFGAKWRNRKVGDVILDFIEFLVLTPELEVFTIDSYDGEKKKIDRDYLRSKRASKDFIKGFIPHSDGFHVSKDNGQYIFINKTQFENFLDDKLIDANEIKDTVLKFYTPPYVEFMLQAVKALNLSPDKRANINELTEWLNQNWPDNLEGKSENMIKYMATLLRRPEDKKGGNTAWKTANKK